MLTFDEASHTYRWNGEKVASVTQILQDVGLIDYSSLPLSLREMALERGRTVHTVTHWDDEGDLDESSVDPQIVPYLAAWRRFRMDTGFVPELIEHRAYSPEFGYAGTLDRAGRFPGGRKALIDLKNSLVPEFARYQLAAYSKLLPESRAWQHIAVELHADETYRAVHIPASDWVHNWGVFCSALNVYNAKRDSMKKARSEAA